MCQRPGKASDETRVSFVAMDREEVLSIARAEVAELRQATYSQLAERLIDKQENVERVGASGASYQVEIQAFWDNKPNGNLRVIVSIDDGGWRAFIPLSEDFIRAPDGSFIGG
jgi:hypothetical protein